MLPQSPTHCKTLFTSLGMNTLGPGFSDISVVDEAPFTVQKLIQDLSSFPKSYCPVAGLIQGLLLLKLSSRRAGSSIYSETSLPWGSKYLIIIYSSEFAKPLNLKNYYPQPKGPDDYQGPLDFWSLGSRVEDLSPPNPRKPALEALQTLQPESRA